MTQRLIAYGKRSWNLIRREGFRSFLKTAKHFLRRDIVAHRWWCKNRPTRFNCEKMQIHLKTFSYQPTISLIVPVYNPKPRFLVQMIESVQAQIYPNWELCLCDDASTDPRIQTILKNYADKDRRIKVITHSKNTHICGASNSALTLATGDYVGLLDHDDLLAQDALYHIIGSLQGNPKNRPEFIYSDEDKINRFGFHHSPFFKPDWSPELLLSIMYTGHFTVYKRTLVKKIGGFRKGYEGSQDHDLALRISEQTDRIVHIPKILYHWRIHGASTAGGISVKEYCLTSAKKALSNGLKRRKCLGTVSDGLWLGSYRTRFEIHGNPLISILIPFRDHSNLLKNCLKTIAEKTTYKNIELLLVNNDSSEPETHAYLDLIQQKNFSLHTKIRVIDHPHPFNFSTINNVAAKHAKGDFLLFLNNDTEIITPDWIEALLEYAQQPNIAAVGAKLLYPNHTVQHAGVVMGIAGTCSHAFRHVSDSIHGTMGLKDVVRNVSAVTAACLMMSKKVFEELEGFEEDYAIAYQDVDLCLRALQKDYRNVYTPYAMLIHHESVSRKVHYAPHETERLKREWAHFIERDPYYNPNLSLNFEDYRLE